MGNSAGTPTNQKKRQPVKTIRTDVSPFREGQLELVQESQTLSKLIHPKRKRANLDSPSNEASRNLQVRKIKDNQVVQENLEIIVVNLQKRNGFKQAELETITQNFEYYSKDNIMGRQKLLQYFNMEQLEDTGLGNQFFQCAKNTFSQKQTGSFLDYSKFLKTISMLGKEGQQGRLNYIYQIFDLDLMGKVEKSEMKQVF